jgi:hypothetical protein
MKKRMSQIIIISPRGISFFHDVNGEYIYGFIGTKDDPRRSLSPPKKKKVLKKKKKKKKLQAIGLPQNNLQKNLYFSPSPSNF